MAGGLMVAVVAVSAFQLLPVSVAALVAAMLVIGSALEKTPTVELVAQFISRHAAAFSPLVRLSLIILSASVQTNFLFNSAVATFLVPLAIKTARLLQTDPRPFLIGVTSGASACIATPITFQTNTLVFSAGGYRFMDFLPVGLPLNLVHWLLASTLIPYL